MADVTQILSRIESGDPSAAEQLLPLVYDELRQLAAVTAGSREAGPDTPGHGARPRSLSCGWSMRETAQHWNSRGHFFAAAAEAMRRILVERARAKGRLKRERRTHRVDLNRLTIDTCSDPRRSSWHSTTPSEGWRQQDA